MNQYKLAERAVLMQLSAGMPGKHRKDRALSAQVKTDKNLGQHAGSWVKNKYPDWALEPIEKLVTEARAYHSAVTLNYATGIGILPAPLIMEYADKMREFAGRFNAAKDGHFRARYQEMIEWAKVEHNGTFDPSDYPDADEVCQAFYFRTEPVPVPDAGHYESSIKSLLGVDGDSVNQRVQDAMEEAQKELMRRLIAPVKAMAVKLSEAPKEGKDSPVFRDTLIANVKDIAKLAPKLNIAGDPAIDQFVKDMNALAGYVPDSLRESAKAREAAAADAKAVLAKLEGYKLA